MCSLDARSGDDASRLAEKVPYGKMSMPLEIA